MSGRFCNNDKIKTKKSRQRFIKSDVIVEGAFYHDYLSFEKPTDLKMSERTNTKLKNNV